MNICMFRLELERISVVGKVAASGGLLPRSIIISLPRFSCVVGLVMVAYVLYTVLSL